MIGLIFIVVCVSMNVYVLIVMDRRLTYVSYTVLYCPIKSVNFEDTVKNNSDLIFISGGSSFSHLIRVCECVVNVFVYM